MWPYVFTNSLRISNINAQKTIGFSSLFQFRRFYTRVSFRMICYVIWIDCKVNGEWPRPKFTNEVILLILSIRRFIKSMKTHRYKYRKYVVVWCVCVIVCECVLC